MLFRRFREWRARRRHVHDFTVTFAARISEKKTSDGEREETNRFFIMERCHCGFEQAWDAGPYCKEPVNAEWLRQEAKDRQNTDIIDR